MTFEIPSDQEYIVLIQLLKAAGLARSGGEAQQLVTDGRVMLNGATETRKRAKLRVGDVVTCGGKTVTIANGQ